MLMPTEWQDEWISEHYPEAVFFVQMETGEVGVMLGLDTNNSPCT